MEHAPVATVEVDKRSFPGTFEDRVSIAMRNCNVLGRLGCTWEDKLCDDEIGVETGCPGQALRVYRRMCLTDSEVDL